MYLAFALLALLADASAAGAKAASTDDEVWALARKVNTDAAYKTYLDRFRYGAHASEASAHFAGRPSRPVLVAPPAPPRFLPVPPPMAPVQVDPCADLISNQQMTVADTADGRAFLQAQRSNRLTDYKKFAADFPNSACVKWAYDRVEAREKLKVASIRGFGPLAAHARSRMVFSIDDYPARALQSGEQGRVVAEWDVADDGVVESCHAIESSGSATLDDATCRIITRRMHYDPARNAAGDPVRSTDHMPVVWAMAQDEPEPVQAPK